MPRNTLVINCDFRETRVALIEEGIIAELQIERAAARGTVGNIVLGKVTRVLPGMQAAFIDVGMDRAAFLAERWTSAWSTVHKDLPGLLSFVTPLLPPE